MHAVDQALVQERITTSRGMGRVTQLSTLAGVFLVVGVVVDVVSEGATGAGPLGLEPTQWAYLMVSVALAMAGRRDRGIRQQAIHRVEGHLDAVQAPGSMREELAVARETVSAARAEPEAQRRLLLFMTLPLLVTLALVPVLGGAWDAILVVLGLGMLVWEAYLRSPGKRSALVDRQVHWLLTGERDPAD